MLKIYIFTTLVGHAATIALLFTGLSLLGSPYIYKQITFNKVEFFECGFDSTSPLSEGSTNQILIVAIFMLIYDVEIILLLPTFFDMAVTVYSMTYLLAHLVAIIVVSCLWDAQYDALHYNR